MTAGPARGATRVDFHTHAIPAELPDFATTTGDPRWPVFRVEGGTGRLWVDGVAVRAVPPTAWSAADRVEYMDSTGTDVHVLSPLPPLAVDWAPPAQASEFCARVNDGLAAIVAEAPARLLGFAMVPLQDPSLALAELERAHGLGFRGVQIGTRTGEMELDHPSVREFFARCAELGMVVFVHPLFLGTSVSWTSRISGVPLTFGLGMTTDTALAAAALILGGVTTDLPDLKVCLAHGGGTFVWSLPRLEVGRALAGLPNLDDALRNVYVDTAVYDGANLQYLIARLGADRMVTGTDFPLPAADTVTVTGDAFADLPPEVAGAVAGANAAHLLGLPA